MIFRTMYGASERREGEGDAHAVGGARGAYRLGLWYRSQSAPS